jgi:hypothetical protein
MSKVRIGTLAVALAAAGGLILSLGPTAIGQVAEGDVKKIADLIKKGDMPGAKKAAEAFAKSNEMLDIMNAFLEPKKKGFTVVGTTQGIEQVLLKIGRDAPSAANMTKMADSYTDMGYTIAALGLVTEAKVPEKDVGKMTRKSWLEAAAMTVEAGVKLAAAAKNKSPADLKTHAAKVNTGCANCHTIHR